MKETPRENVRNKRRDTRMKVETIMKGDVFKVEEECSMIFTE